ncbi:hypothetical protein [Bacillus thuringiensis]|uniref:hypothetical protein n=1 Tax=Bacillus thuringiensis TaxID=1428 RepID=UPI00211A7FCA|nr:hypothetical protein [Bacillus thuringiensis]
MKKFIWTNLPVVIVLVFIVPILDYNNLNTWGYICIVGTILAIILMIINMVILYIKEKKNV